MSESSEVIEFFEPPLPSNYFSQTQKISPQSNLMSSANRYDSYHSGSEITPRQRELDDTILRQSCQENFDTEVLEEEANVGTIYGCCSRNVFIQRPPCADSMAPMKGDCDDSIRMSH